MTDRFEIAKRLHVADADVRSVDWVGGECYVTLSSGTVKRIREVGYETVAGVPTLVETVSETTPEPTPDANVQVVIEWVGGDRDRARQALTDERARARPRKGLLAYLERLTA